MCVRPCGHSDGNLWVDVFNMNNQHTIILSNTYHCQSSERHLGSKSTVQWDSGSSYGSFEEAEAQG
jgi:hypothetical protein